MRKTIRNSVSCESCGSTKISEIYETYCDECKKLIERGPTYGSKISYTIIDNKITNLDIRSEEKEFCSYDCLLKSMSKERLGKSKYISPGFYLERKDLKAFLKAVSNGIR